MAKIENLNADAPKMGLSYIDNHEVDAAKALIDKQFVDITGKPFGGRVCGYYIACKIYVRPEELTVVKGPEGKDVTLWRPDSQRQGDKYQSCSALVIGIGPQAFTGYDAHGHERFPAGPACRVGDWIALPRQQAYVMAYRGVALGIIPDDMPLMIVEDPRDVTPITQASLT